MGYAVARNEALTTEEMMSAIGSMFGPALAKGWVEKINLHDPLVIALLDLYMEPCSSGAQNQAYVILKGLGRVK